MKQELKDAGVDVFGIEETEAWQAIAEAVEDGKITPQELTFINTKIGDLGSDIAGFTLSATTVTEILNRVLAEAGKPGTVKKITEDKDPDTPIKTPIKTPKDPDKDPDTPLTITVTATLDKDSVTVDGTLFEQKIDAELERQGGEWVGELQTARDEVKSAFADGVVTPTESAQIKAAIKTIFGEGSVADGLITELNRLIAEAKKIPTPTPAVSSEPNPNADSDPDPSDPNPSNPNPKPKPKTNKNPNLDPSNGTNGDKSDTLVTGTYTLVLPDLTDVSIPFGGIGPDIKVPFEGIGPDIKIPFAGIGIGEEIPKIPFAGIGEGDEIPKIPFAGIADGDGIDPVIRLEDISNKTIEVEGSSFIADFAREWVSLLGGSAAVSARVGDNSGKFEINEVTVDDFLARILPVTGISDAARQASLNFSKIFEENETESGSVLLGAGDITRGTRYLETFLSPGQEREELIREFQGFGQATIEAANVTNSVLADQTAALITLNTTLSSPLLLDSSSEVNIARESAVIFAEEAAKKEYDVNINAQTNPVQVTNPPNETLDISGDISAEVSGNLSINNIMQIALTNPGRANQILDAARVKINSGG